MNLGIIKEHLTLNEGRKLLFLAIFSANSRSGEVSLKRMQQVII